MEGWEARKENQGLILIRGATECRPPMDPAEKGERTSQNLCSEEKAKGTRVLTPHFLKPQQRAAWGHKIPVLSPFLCKLKEIPQLESCRCPQEEAVDMNQTVR